MTAVITGASSGIGRELAIELAKRGFDVVLVARRKERLVSLQKEITKRYLVKAFVYVCDLQNTSECYDLFEFCKDKKVRIFINNAGVGSVGYINNTSYQDEKVMLDTNLISVHLLTKLFAKYMKKGIILNVSSMAAFQPGPGMTVYGATKAYVYQFSRGLNYELRKQGSHVRVVTLCPGPVATEFDMNQHTSYIRKLFTLSAKECAKIAVKEMLQGKELIIPGLMNKVLRGITKIVPENLMLYIEHKIQISKVNNA